MLADTLRPYAECDEVKIYLDRSLLVVSENREPLDDFARWYIWEYLKKPAFTKLIGISLFGRIQGRLPSSGHLSARNGREYDWDNHFFIEMAQTKAIDEFAAAVRAEIKDQISKRNTLENGLKGEPDCLVIVEYSAELWHSEREKTVLIDIMNRIRLAEAEGLGICLLMTSKPGEWPEINNLDSLQRMGFWNLAYSQLREVTGEWPVPEGYDGETDDMASIVLLTGETVKFTPPKMHDWLLVAEVEKDYSSAWQGQDFSIPGETE